MDASTSISSSIAALNNEINKEFDENEDWVLVKKQKIIILIPPPSPRSQETQTYRRSKQAKQQRAGESSISKKIKENRLSKIRNNKSSLVPDHSNHVIEMSMLCKSQFNVQNIGVVNVVNRRIKAKNLERKLQSLGGLRKWLASLGLEWFAVVLEMKNLNQYQLVNLTMSKLKDMGIKAVGPRRKLIHAIDILCRPYYCSGI
ncbi:hypothetical protein AXF42_Ash006125 [Apostasia shenzhenica]|uniref:SAM domain-containing protein n=1 Tax=Apostasia shenzhenica TaxID=1088818 RepID=A0A2I0B0A5_9ASPA|nr:hypothetical protein AXF42_Ash006125 [Apostasia shenzhenica]